MEHATCYRSIAHVTATSNVATTVIAVSVTRSVSFAVLPIRAQPAKPRIIAFVKTFSKACKVGSVAVVSLYPAGLPIPLRLQSLTPSVQMQLTIRVPHVSLLRLGQNQHKLRTLTPPAAAVQPETTLPGSALPPSATPSSPPKPCSPRQCGSGNQPRSPRSAAQAAPP